MMKKKILAILMAALMVVSLIPIFAFTALAADKKVKFVMADVEQTQVEKIIVDGKVEAPKAPDIDEYNFVGWYYYDITNTYIDEQQKQHTKGMQKLDPNNVPNIDITVYAVYLLNHKKVDETEYDLVKSNFKPYSQCYIYSFDGGKNYTNTIQKKSEAGNWNVWIQGRALDSSIYPEIVIEIGDAVIHIANNIVIQKGECGSAYAIVDGKKVTDAVKDAEVTLVATPNEGYELEKWEVVSGEVTIENDKFKMPETDVNIKPIFKKMIEYKITKGEKQEIDLTDVKDAVFASEAEYAKFIGVKIDDKTVDANNYTVESGSTVVTLKAEYLKTLKVGKHEIKILSEDGIASAEFTVKEATPKTADANNMMLWLALAFVAVGLATGTVLKVKKTNK